MAGIANLDCARRVGLAANQSRVVRGQGTFTEHSASPFDNFLQEEGWIEISVLNIAWRCAINIDAATPLPDTSPSTNSKLSDHRY